jgi:hypothetical protein
MAVIVSLLVLFILTFWVVVKGLKIASLLARYNMRDGVKTGFYRENVGLFGIKKLIKDAKQWDKEKRAYYNK